MTLPGLHHLIATKRTAAGAAARTGREAEATDPRMAHECAVTAERLALEAEGHAEHLHGNEQTMEGIMHQIDYLTRSTHQSRCRKLAITALEEAHNWLMRENGTPEPERNFEIIADGHRPPLQTNGQSVS